jgi:AraC-like DNA-binding protein/tetratricopeptide (TPR) repeat protein
VETLLQLFDQQTDVTKANNFFDELKKQDFLDEPIVFAKGTPTDSLQQQVWYWAAEWMYDQQRYEQAEQYALKALAKYHSANPEKADCLNTLGCIYVRLSNFEQAANYAKQSVEMEMKGGDHDRISSSMNTLAGIYMAGNQAKEAEQIILQALEHANQANNPGRKAIILGMASEIYHTLADDEKALAYAAQAYDIEQELGRQPKMIIRLSQIGSAELGLHHYEKAEEVFRRIIPSFREMGDFHSMAIALNRLGMSLLCQNRQREAIPYYREAAGLFSKMGDLYNEIHSHRGLYECYWKINPDSAKIELDYFDLLKDSLYSHSTAEALSRYNAEFGNDLLQQENVEVRQAHLRTIIIAIVVILMLSLIAWWYVLRTHQKEQQHVAELMHEIELLKAGINESQSITHAEPTNAATTDAPLTSEADRAFLMRVIEVVNEGFADKQLGVEIIASKLNMSVQTFRRRLMNTAGETPKAFISAIQMEKAGKLLTEHPEQPVVDVAFKCGFDDASSFTHTFKRVYGITPSQYREKNG